ncbi:MAG: hypothetical protein [Podoviridae sp. ctLUJ1]|nr:MAG: hypothetical protein [Podoviridae sp. ctLUJ1]
MEILNIFFLHIKNFHCGSMDVEISLIFFYLGFLKIYYEEIDVVLLP